jgi:hypothetical protein
MIQKCSLQYAKDHRFFGPIYHGTSPENREMIEQMGFQIFIGEERSGHIRNGYLNQPYSDGIPAPIHHLGFGIYFTTVLNIAKQYNEGSSKNIPTYYLDSDAIETINFGAANTQMKWWIKNGYNPAVAKIDRLTATRLLTDRLKSQWDAVWYKGKGLYRLLDGDQVCVYRPELIFQIDKGLSNPGEIGGKAIRKSDGMTGIILDIRKIPPEISERYHNGEPAFLTIRWKRGGTDRNVYPSQVTFPEN